MANLNERDWGILLRRIRDKECTPFLGAGASAGTLPLGGQIAREWAEKYHFPLDDQAHDLARVAQYLALGDARFPKQEIRERLLREGEPDFSEDGEPHAVLAELELPLYLTTNYDGFMTKALRLAGVSPSREACRWAGNGADDGEPTLFDSAQGFDPTPEAPVVYHLHGHLDDLDSIVLTEDDYLDFLVSISRRPEVIPPRVHEALGGSSLLFVGYQLADWDFRVLFRWIVEAIDRSDRYLNLTVQIPREGDPARVEAIHRYLDDYFDEMKVQTYWGSAREFASELRTRWRAFKGPDGSS